MKKPQKFEWIRIKETDRNTCTRVDDKNMTKESWLDCMNDLMIKGNLTIVDILNYYSPPNKR